MLAPIAELERTLSKLPGFGRRSASRAALALVREPAKLMVPLMEALAEAQRGVCVCERCGAFTTRDKNPCDYCTDPMREENILCVVEDASDIVSIEASGAFHGRYHVLGGKLSPMKHMGPEKLNLASLISRLDNEPIHEILFALSTDMEGDATAGYLAQLVEGRGIKLTRLAFGLPVDSGIAYSDPLTLRRAIFNRIAN